MKIHKAFATVTTLPLLAACQAPPLQIRPVGASLASVQMAAEREDADYASAKAAIARRDYADALEWLQSARARTPSDVRVLNAFGVVYDKLGRFDLSQRYYQQALEIDHTSDIVVHNLAYSRSLQTRIVASPVSWELADIKPPPSVAASPAAAPIAVAAAATAPARPRHLLTIVNATGHAGGEQAVFDHLAGLRWSISHRRVELGAQVPGTTIRYASPFLPQARALARTLPGHPRLIEADGQVQGVKLVLGVDATTWKLPLLARN